ncbi:hypothetical protein HU200_031776 [Digitaria exilis]|uniref:BZIP domain-containing protein n=1 Tax=Digitaria exilis TaxID=1010633 RepID=A0A835EPD4_9POAL|nr:hypothetical protein HU200_031776 [Digitaria exilis]
MNFDELLKSVFPGGVDPDVSVALSRKTVDEVWKGIQDGPEERQPTLGEMTLEDFLVKAGVVTEGLQTSLVGSYMASQLAPQPLSVATGAMLDSVCSNGQITSPTLGSFLDHQTPGRKRGASGEVVDKVIERRQKRMIKNRESAARSRARKQAYTNELENKVSHLEEENERLKKQKVLLSPVILILFSFSCLSAEGLHVKLSVLAKLLFFR